MDIVDIFGNFLEEVCFVEISKEIFRVFFLNIVFLVFCIFIGVFGNVIVVFVYIVWLGGEGEGWYFVLYLVLVDVFFVSFFVGFNLFFNLFFVNYNDEMLCKCSWFFGYLIIVMFVLLLLVIVV